MSFFGNLLKKHGKNATDGITTFVVTLDPETAKEAEIETKNDELKKASLELEDARKAFQKEQAEADKIVALHKQRIAAALHMEEQLKTATDEGQKTELGKSLTKMLDLIDSMTADVEREEQEAADAKMAFDSVLELTELLAKELLEARKGLDQSIAKVKSAETAKQLAERQAERAERIAGIKEQSSKASIALDVMNKKAAALETEANAARTRAKLLTQTKGETEDANIAAAMAAVSGTTTPFSLEERLAALKNK